MSVLSVYFQDDPCAQLTEDAQGRLAFRYLDTWVDGRSIPVSIRLPVSAESYSHEIVAPFVASFLPEGESLRHRLEKLLHVDAEHDFGLLAAIGRESAGALSFWPEGDKPESGESGYIGLSDDEFDRWREVAHRLPLQFPGREIRLSLAGVQSKTALYFDEAGRAFLPEHGAPTTHILKPRIPGCRPNSAFVELVTMRIARAVLGEDRVPETDLWKNCYRVRRFDRPRSAGGVNRLHQEDFCLALGRMPYDKYQRGSPQERLLATCFDLIDRLGRQGLVRSPAVERMRLLDQVIVNVLLHNPDAHLKNYAFLYGEDGTLEVAPLYDCLCTAGLTFHSVDAPAYDAGNGPEAHTRALSLRIGNCERIDRVGVEDWEAFAEECGFTRAFVRRRLKMLAEAVGDQVNAVIEGLVTSIPVTEQASRQVCKGALRQVDRALATTK